MSARLIAQRYAKALLDLAVKADGVEGVRQELEAVRQLVWASPDLQRLVEARLIGPSRKAEVFDRILERAGATQLVRRFFRVVSQAARLDLLHAIVEAYDQLVDQRNGVIEALVTSAAPLSEPQSTALARSLQGRTGRSVRLKAMQDPALIGGLKVQLGSTIYDATLDARLRLLRAKLCSD